jgi:hypothetical protein
LDPGVDGPIGNIAGMLSMGLSELTFQGAEFRSDGDEQRQRQNPVHVSEQWF